MAVEFTIRAAVPSDAPLISDLARRAKGHWGYSQEWMRLWTADLTFTPDYLTAHQVFVAVSDRVPVGVCALETTDDVGILEHCWIAPDQQGLGIGRALVQRALEEAGRMGLTRISVVSDPFAEQFYLKMGAHPVRAISAPMPGEPGRTLQELEFRLSSQETR